MIDALLGEPRVLVDTAPLIYFLSGDAPRSAVTRALLVAASRGEIALVLSTLTEAELLVAPLRHEDPKPLIAAIRDLIAGPPELDVHDVSRPIARQAAQLRASHNLRLADAIIAATAVAAGCTALLGNDKHFRRLELERLTYYHVDDLCSG